MMATSESDLISAASQFYGADSKNQPSGSGYFASRIRDSVKESQSFYLADAKSGVLFEEETAEDDSGDDDESEIDEDQVQFYNDILDGNANLSGQDPLWEMKSTLNASLSKLFDRQPVFRGDESKWDRPLSHGLHNSAPIVPTKHNQAKALQQSTNSSFHQSEAKSDVKLVSAPYINDLIYNGNTSLAKNTAPQNTLYNLIQANNITYDTHKQVLSTNTTQLQQTNNDDEQDEGEDDDDDDGDYEYEADDEDDDEAAFRNMGGMSADLMALLGIQADPNAQSAAPIDDWVPPSHAGLDNSDPLIAKQKMHYMQNGIATADNDDDEDEEEDAED
jgi:hypothetical protein